VTLNNLTPPSYPIPERKPKILLIGATHAAPVIEIYPLLQGMGYHITCVGASKADPTLHSPVTHLNLLETATKTQTFNMDAFGMGINSVDYIRERSLEAILDVLGRDDFDFILHFQDWTFFTEESRFRIPYFYVMSEAWVPRVPKGAWKVFCGTEGCEQIVNYFYPNMPTELMSYSPMSFFLQKQLPPERPIRASFAGTLYAFDELYKKRRNIVEGLYKAGLIDAHVPLGRWNYGMEYRPKIGKGKLSLDAYAELLLHSQIGINVTTAYGSNYRDFEICAAGAMLLTSKTPDHTRLGFEDGVNCRFFTTLDEAKTILQTITDDEIERIAAAGRLFVNHQHNYMKRTLDLLTAIAGDLRNGEPLF
jgi:hypothetical protein